MAKHLQFLNVNIYVITFFIDSFVVFVCINRYVKLNSGKVGRNSRREATEVHIFFLHLFSLNLLSKIRLCLCVCVFNLLTKFLVHLSPLKTIVISTKDGCPTLLANDGYFGQACTLFYFYSCLFCKFKLISVVVVVVVVVVAQTPVSANPGLNFNPGFFFFS